MSVLGMSIRGMKGMAEIDAAIRKQRAEQEQLAKEAAHTELTKRVKAIMDDLGYTVKGPDKRWPWPPNEAQINSMPVQRGVHKAQPMTEPPPYMEKALIGKVDKAKLLDMAKEAVAGRGLNYGKPEANFERIARLFAVHVKNRYGVDVPFDAASVAMLCAYIKLARLENSPKHLDSWVDLAGYAACGAEITNG